MQSDDQGMGHVSAQATAAVYGHKWAHAPTNSKDESPRLEVRAEPVDITLGGSMGTEPDTFHQYIAGSARYFADGVEVSEAEFNVLSEAQYPSGTVTGYEGATTTGAPYGVEGVRRRQLGSESP